jgi:hypothetical protein
MSPPAEPVLGACSNDSVHVSFPQGTYHGFSNLYIQIAHTYEDDRLVNPRTPAYPVAVFKQKPLTTGRPASVKLHSTY